MKILIKIKHLYENFVIGERLSFLFNSVRPITHHKSNVTQKNKTYKNKTNDHANIPLRIINNPLNIQTDDNKKS